MCFIRWAEPCLASCVAARVLQWLIQAMMACRGVQLMSGPPAPTWLSLSVAKATKCDGYWQNPSAKSGPEMRNAPTQ